jgi:hypothetical protein
MEGRPMSVLNRRNALVGWLAWTVLKGVVASKLRRAAPAVDTETKRPNRAAIIAVLATLGLGAWLARHYIEGDEAEGGDAEGGDA